MKFKQLSSSEWEAVRKPYDFHVRLEDGTYVVDVFNDSIEDPDEAYVASEQFETWEEVEGYCGGEPTLRGTLHPSPIKKTR